MDKFNVFEYTAEVGGYQGCRFITPFSSTDEQPKNTHTVLVAKGVTNEEATDLVACCPEICYLLAAVEKATPDKATGQTQNEVLMLELKVTSMAIRSNRDRRRQKGLSIDENIAVFSPPDNSTVRNRIINNLKETFGDGLGYLGDLGIANFKMAIAISKAYLPEI